MWYVNLHVVVIMEIHKIQGVPGAQDLWQPPLGDWQPPPKSASSPAKLLFGFFGLSTSSFCPQSHGPQARIQNLHHHQ